MAMTPRPQPPEAHHSSGDSTTPEPDTRVVDQAASALRNYTDHGWNRASPRILEQIMKATRRSRPVRAQGDDGPFRVSDQVVTTYLQAAIDTVHGAEATHIGLELNDDALVGLRLAVAVDYPRPVHPLADDVRRIACECIKQVLGHIDPALDPADIDIHIYDVNPPAGLT